MSLNKDKKAPETNLCDACEEFPIHIDNLCNYCYYDKPSSDDDPPPPPPVAKEKKKKRKKIINKKPKLEHYDPTFNDSQPLKWFGEDIYDFNNIYNIVFNNTDDFIPMLKDKWYWKCMINTIKNSENTGIIDDQITNITLVEKRKSVMKLFFKIFRELNDAE